MAKGRKTGGRLPGSANKLTLEAKEAIEIAFEGIGGVEELMAWARTHRTTFYGRIWTKILPRDMKVTGEVLHRLESLVTAGLKAEDAERKTVQ
jgi:hypothetical protein